MKRAAASPERPVYEKAEQIGEDPFEHLCSGKQEAISRIKGIVRLDRLQAYVECEHEVGPRKKVIAAIYQRKAQLEDRDDLEDLEIRLTGRTSHESGGEQCV